MISRGELINNRKLCQEKSLGCLIGLAVGDAMGDLARIDEYRKRYGIITTLYDGVKSTDDTEFALLTARTLLDCEAHLSPESVLQSWKTHILDQGGIIDRGGRPLYGAVENLRRGMTPPRSGIDNVFNNDDGAAMRIAPIGIVCAGEPERAGEMAEIEAQISHCAGGVWAARAVAAGVAMAMVDGSTEEIIDAGCRQIPEDSWLYRAMACSMEICDQEGCIEGAWERLHSELWTPEHATAEEAIPQSFAVFRLNNGDFQKNMIWGANFGRDADTIGAIVGALSGARHGVSIIPKDWVEKVKHPAGICLKFTAGEDIVTLGKQLAELIS